MDVIPIPLTDQQTPINNLRTRTFFIVEELLDTQKLKDGLDTLIRNHWRKLGARLVSTPKDNRLEYHLPQVFEDGYKLFEWSSKTHVDSLKDIEEFTPFLSPGPGIAFLPSMDLIDISLRPYGWPFERKNEPTDAPLLYVHVTNFSDATVIAMSCPHTLADQHGVANIVKAWLAVVRGEAVPDMVGYKEDPLPQGKPYDQYPADEISRKGRMRLRGWMGNVIVVMGIIREMISNRKEESHILFLPNDLIQSLRERANQELTEKLGSAPNLSTGDILTAILLKFSRINLASTQTLGLSQTVNLRGRVPALADKKGDAFVHNGLHYSTAHFEMDAHTPLYEIAHHNRKAINQALGDHDIEIGLAVSREMSRRRQVMLICEPFETFFSVSNWCGAWDDLKFEDAAVEAPKKEADAKPRTLVFGQSKIENSPQRFRAAIMCRREEGFWCDFAAPPKTIASIKEYLKEDPLLEKI